MNQTTNPQAIRANDRNGKQLHEYDIVRWGDLPTSKESPVRIAVVLINPDIQFHCLNNNNQVFHYGCFAYQMTELEIIGTALKPEELPEDMREAYFSFCDGCGDLFPTIWLENKDYQDDSGGVLNNSFSQLNCLDCK